MKKARNKQNLERAVAEAHFQLALFHDNNSRENEAIPEYKLAIQYGLDAKSEAEAYAWLASSYHKTAQPRKATKALRVSRSKTNDAELLKFLQGLEKRISQRSTS